MGEIALTENFHANHGFAGGFHLAKNADDGLRVGVHVRADGIDAGEIDFDPGGFRGGAQSFDAVAGAAVSADDSLLLGFGENVHDAAVALGPIRVGEAVRETDIEIVGAELAAEAIEIGAGGDGIAGPGFREHGDFVARDVLERFGDVRMASVGIGGVEEAEAMIVAVEEKIGEPFNAERSLVGMMAGADRAGAHGEPTGLDAGAAEGDGIGGGEFGGKRWAGESGQQIFRGEPAGAEAGGGANEEFAAMHGNLRSGLRLLAFGRGLSLRLHQATATRAVFWRRRRKAEPQGRRVPQNSSRSGPIRTACGRWRAAAGFPRLPFLILRLRFRAPRSGRRRGSPGPGPVRRRGPDPHRGLRVRRRRTGAGSAILWFRAGVGGWLQAGAGAG